MNAQQYKIFPLLIAQEIPPYMGKLHHIHSLTHSFVHNFLPFTPVLSQLNVIKISTFP